MSSKSHNEYAELLAEIEEYLEARQMGANYFGKQAVGNSDLVPRLRRGGRVWPETQDKVREYIKLNQPFLEAPNG